MAARERRHAAASGGRRGRRVHVGERGRPGVLAAFPRALGLVICVHAGAGTGDPDATSGRPPDLVRVLHQHRLATLFVDLLDDSEERRAPLRQQLALLTSRTVETLDWAAGRAEIASLRAGLCAAGMAAAAALRCAAERPASVAAIVARSGRPDLAGAALARIAVPTLFIVGGRDAETVQINREAMLVLGCEKRLEVVPGATRRFEEPGALEAMAHLAGGWLAARLGTHARH